MQATRPRNGKKLPAESAALVSRSQANCGGVRKARRAREKDREDAELDDFPERFASVRSAQFLGATGQFIGRPLAEPRIKRAGRPPFGLSEI